MIAEWDAIAGFRARQLEDERDLTYYGVLAPTIMDMLGGRDVDSILDAGCGVGALLPQLIQRTGHLEAIDPSANSVREAQARTQRSSDTPVHLAAICRVVIHRVLHRNSKHGAHECA